MFLTPTDGVPVVALCSLWIHFIRTPQTKQKMSAQFMEDDEMPSNYDVDDVRSRMRAALRADQVSVHNSLGREGSQMGGAHSSLVWHTSWTLITRSRQDRASFASQRLPMVNFSWSRGGGRLEQALRPSQMS